MVRELSFTKKEELKSEIKNAYPELTNEELNKINVSVEQLVNTISLKTHRKKEDVEKLLTDRIDFINSKHLS